MSNDVDFSKLEVSNDELLRGITSSALAAFQYMAKVDSVADQKEITQYTNSFVKGLKSLNEGWDPDLYESVLESLEDVKTASTNPDYDETYQLGLRDVHELGTIAVDRLKVIEDAMVAGETRVNNLNEDMSLLAKRSPDSLDIIQDIGRTEIGKIEGLATTSAKRLSNRVTDITDSLNYINMLNKRDIDKDIEGFQIDLNEASAEYYQKIAEEAGFGRLKTDEDVTEGIVSYYLPEDMELKSENYANALATLNKYENSVLESEVNLRKQTEIAEDMEIFQVMNEWATAPSSSIQAHKFQAITDLVFMDDPNDMPTSMLFISEADRHDVQNKVKMIEELKNKYPGAIADLQALDLTAKEKYSKIKAKILEKGIEAQEEKAELLTNETASNILLSTATVNKQITAWNQGHTDDVQMPHITVYSDVDKIKGTVDLNKRLHVDVLNQLLEKRGDHWGWNNAVDVEPILKDFVEATTYHAKYQAMSRLRNKYLYSDGSDKKESHILFHDADSVTPLFIPLLQSFDWLLKADPTGRVTADEFGG